MSYKLIDGDDEQLKESLKSELERERLRKLAREAEIELMQKYAKKSQSVSNDSGTDAK